MFERSIAGLARAADRMAMASDSETLAALVQEEIAALVGESKAAFGYLRISVLPLCPPVVFPCHAIARDCAADFADHVLRTGELRVAEAGGRVSAIAPRGQLGVLLQNFSLEQAWLIVSGRSLLGSNHALFAFRESPTPLSADDWANLSVRINVLVGSICHLLIEENWRDIGEAISEHHRSVRLRLAVSDRLNDGEIEVVQLILAGHRIATIAELLFLSPHTVRNRLKRVFRSLDVRSQAELVTLLRSMSQT